MPEPEPPAPPLARPSPLRLCAGLSLVGVAIFALLYCPQALLPTLATAFGQNAAGASLAVSAGTLAMAAGLIPAGLLSDRIGRKTTIVGAMLLAALLTVACAFAPDWRALVILRALCGAALAGAPAAAMAYIGEEAEPAFASTAMGVYIGATALGGMAGRLGAGVAAEAFGWREALFAVGAGGVIAAGAFWMLLPRARRFAPNRRSLAAMPGALAQALAQPVAPWLVLEAGLLMGGFVTIYNYGAFRLSAAPYLLSEGRIGAVFALYIVGALSSPLFGAWAGRAGPARVLPVAVGCMIAGVLLTLVQPLWGVIGALGLLTFGFFGAHAVGSAWMGRAAGAARAQGAAIYLVAYYLGSSVLGSAGGLVWERFGWGGIVAYVGALAGLALLVALRLLRISASASAASADDPAPDRAHGQGFDRSASPR